MYNLFTTKTFDKKLKRFLKKHPDLEEEIVKTLDLLAKNPFEPHLKMHKLSGLLKNERAVSLSYEHRILFVWENDNIFLTNIGTHDEVY